MLSLVFLYVFNFGLLVFMSCVNYIIEKKKSNTQHNTTPTHTPVTTKKAQLMHQSPQKQKNPAPHTFSKHYNTNLTLPHCPPPQRHNYAHPIIHLLYQLTKTLHSLPRQNPKIHPPIHNSNTCHSPSTSSSIAPTISPN